MKQARQARKKRGVEEKAGVSIMVNHALLAREYWTERVKAFVSRSESEEEVMNEVGRDVLAQVGVETNLSMGLWVSGCVWCSLVYCLLFVVLMHNICLSKVCCSEALWLWVRVKGFKIHDRQYSAG